MYIIIGGGLAAASAVEGIRERDRENPIALLSNEKHLPYDRPPLSKKLWFGKMTVEQIFLHDINYYNERNVEVQLGAAVVSIDPRLKTVTNDAGRVYQYEKLLIATGGRPRALPIPGGNCADVCYYRSLDDYRRIRSQAAGGKRAVVIGGGFIGSEIAAALAVNGINVTMIFPDTGLCGRVFPEYFAKSMLEYYRTKGITVLSEDIPTALTVKGSTYYTRTKKGKDIESDILIAGIGISPETSPAAALDLRIENGIVVDEFLETSHPDIYAAGDNARFPCKALGAAVRVEHWDNALNQGRRAGANMAGAKEPFTYLPYFFSDLFEFGYEAVGEVDSALKTFADWQEENKKGVIYYLRHNRVRGVMLCNVWDKVNEARALVEKGGSVTEEDLRGALH
jgi:NADPH-dependent 2,4-dienoyl-CoA reductase/sulfur reductase-like enzyme